MTATNLIVDVTLIGVNLALMLASLFLMAVWRFRQHSLFAAVYGAALTVGLVVLVRGVVRVAMDPSPAAVFAPVFWGGIVYVQALLYQTRARASFHDAVWEPATRRWVTGRSFSAVLLPLDMPTEDGRPGRLAGDWCVCRGGAPVWIDDPDGGRRVVGRIDAVWIDETEPAGVYGSGVIAEGVDMAGRVPEVSFNPLHGGRSARSGPGLFPAARIVKVRMAQHPAFDGMWLNYKERPQP